MIAVIIAAYATEREAVMATALQYTTVKWEMTADNRTGACAAPYESPVGVNGAQEGLPYDWGGFSTIPSFLADIASKKAAGSRSSQGVNACNVGIDCSGFVSRTWGETTKHGTSNLAQITTSIAVADLLAGDALNDAGSHVVLFAHTTAAGRPIYYESAGGVGVRLNAKAGWMDFNKYKPLRYNGITSLAPRPGTASNPVAIAESPFTDLRSTAGAPSDVIDAYTCAKPGPDTSAIGEAGPEVLYQLDVRKGGRFTARLSHDQGADLDIHVLGAATGDPCLARHDSDVSLDLEPGRYWLSVDTFSDATKEYPGIYMLRATFDGEFGEAVAVPRATPGAVQPSGPMPESTPAAPATPAMPGVTSPPASKSWIWLGLGATVLVVGSGLWMAFGRGQRERKG